MPMEKRVHATPHRHDLLPCPWFRYQYGNGRRRRKWKIVHRGLPMRKQVHSTPRIAWTERSKKSGALSPVHRLSPGHRFGSVELNSPRPSAPVKEIHRCEEQALRGEPKPSARSWLRLRGLEPRSGIAVLNLSLRFALVKRKSRFLRVRREVVRGHDRPREHVLQWGKWRAHGEPMGELFLLKRRHSMKSSGMCCI